MGFVRVWSDAQRAAVVAAVLDHGLSNNVAAERAKNGTLPTQGELAPFAMPLGTVQEYTSSEKRRRKMIERAGNEPSNILLEGIGRLVQVYAAEVDSIETAHKAGRLDMRRIRDAASAGHAVLKLQRDLRKTAPTRPSADDDTGEPQGDERDDFLAALPM
jgi:hypothetical protein